MCEQHRRHMVAWLWLRLLRHTCATGLALPQGAQALPDALKGLQDDGDDDGGGGRGDGAVQGLRIEKRNTLGQIRSSH